VAKAISSGRARASEPPRTTSQRAGRFILAQGSPEPFYAFHPEPLPPKPKLHVDARLQGLLDRGNQALGRLDGVTLLLPDPGHVLYSYIRKEAVLSSQIEGTQSSLSDLLLFEQDVAPGVPMGDVEETANYVRAMDHGLRRIREGFPLSLRLLREVVLATQPSFPRRRTRPRRPLVFWRDFSTTIPWPPQSS